MKYLLYFLVTIWGDHDRRFNHIYIYMNINWCISECSWSIPREENERRWIWLLTCGKEKTWRRVQRQLNEHAYNMLIMCSYKSMKDYRYLHGCINLRCSLECLKISHSNIFTRRVGVPPSLYSISENRRESMTSRISLRLIGDKALQEIPSQAE